MMTYYFEQHLVEAHIQQKTGTQDLISVTKLFPLKDLRSKCLI